MIIAIAAINGRRPLWDTFPKKDIVLNHVQHALVFR